MAGLYNGECLPWEWFVVSDYREEHTQNTVHPSRGVARIFQRGGHSRDTIQGSPTI